MSDTAALIERFLEAGPYAVVGASRARHKYGNKVLRAYIQRGLEVYPVNPSETEIEGIEAFPDLMSLPVRPRGVSIITPPSITERIVQDAAEVGAQLVWMQPGAESARAIEIAEQRGLDVIADGSCFLVVSGYRET
jgi:predicted CoA-binding protein